MLFHVEVIAASRLFFAFGDCNALLLGDTLN